MTLISDTKYYQPEEVLQRHNTSGYRGVRQKYSGRPKNWVAEVTHNGKRISIGSFHTAEDAAKARDRYIDRHNLDLVKNFHEVDNVDALCDDSSI